MRYRSLFLEALEADKTLAKLRVLLISLRAEGVDQATLLAELEAMRADLPEADEDKILEAMDLLTGFCAPHLRIDW